MKRIATLLVMLLAVATIAEARGKKPKVPVRDEAKFAAVKRVLLVSVYGPEEIDGGFGQNAKGQELYDRAEQHVVHALKARGIEVVPFETMKALVADQFPAAFMRHVPKNHRKTAESAQGQEALRRGYLLVINRPTASANTRLVYGSDYGWKTSQAHQTGKKGGDKDSFGQPPVEHDETSRKALSELAASAGADAWMVVRIVPTIATTVAKEQSKWNPLGGITKGISAIKAMKEGDHGFAAIDVLMVDSGNEVVWQDQIVGMSKETHGTGGGFNLKMKPEDIEKLTKDALQEAAPLVEASLAGKPAAD